MTKLSNSKEFQILKMAGIVLIPAILFFLPYNYFDSNGPKCLITWLTGVNCYGCGMTRACMRIIHFRFSEAWDFNKLSFIVFPLLAFVWAREGWNSFQHWKQKIKPN
jgi:TRAP-type mannitol/chloroaromatic compound transport system permease large subunit